MAIEERTLPNSNQWEIKATGEDIPKLKGMLDKTAKEGYQKAFHRDEGIGFERVTDPGGQMTAVRKDQLEEALQMGYGKVGGAISMVMPEVPWARKSCGPGRHRFRYDKASGQIVEAS